MPRPPFHFPRRVVQIATLLIIALIPAVGLFRIDLASASFHVLNQQIWWSNFPFIFGLAVVLISVPVLSYVTIGTVWCGWACPQNLLVEWANQLTHKFLGKRADVRVDGKGLVVSSAKDKAINWLTLGILFAGEAMMLALIPLLYFLPPGEVWAFATFRANNQVNSFFTFPYFFISLLLFIDIAFARYFFCDYACFYRVGQIIFKNTNALHIGYDASRAPDCAKCNFCTTRCITEIQPTNIKSGDRCIGCGECVDACDQLHEKSGATGLLRFKTGKRESQTTWWQKLTARSTRLNWIMGAFAILGFALMVLGVITQPIPPSQKSQEEIQKLQRITSVCNNQCAALTTACKGRSIEECYRASACRCECSLRLDPANAESASWRACVINFTALAETLHTRDAGKRP